MTTPPLPHVRVTLSDGNTYRLRFTTNALAEFEHATGQTISSLQTAESIGVRNIRALLWAGLLHDNPRMSIQQAGTLIDPRQIATVGEACAKAIERAFGPSEDAGTGDAPGEANAATPASPGTPS